MWAQHEDIIPWSLLKTWLVWVERSPIHRCEQHIWCLSSHLWAWSTLNVGYETFVNYLRQSPCFKKNSYEQNRCYLCSLFLFSLAVWNLYILQIFFFYKRAETCYGAMSFNLGFHGPKKKHFREEIVSVACANISHTKTNTLNLQSCKDSWVPCSLTILDASSYAWEPH